MSEIMQQFEESIAPNIVYDFKDEFERELFYLNAGLNEEAGEVSGKIKKYMRGDFDMNAEKKEVIAQELGDCLWYLTRMADILGFSLEDIMVLNMRKLAARKEKGTIRGDGDSR